jgi:hypothetical protein
MYDAVVGIMLDGSNLPQKCYRCTPKLRSVLFHGLQRLQNCPNMYCVSQLLIVMPVGQSHTAARRVA